MASAAERRAARNKRRAYTPWAAPTAPPPGTYDPALDAQLGQATRGFLDLQQDTGRNLTRAENDYFRGRDDLNRQYGEGMFDLTRSRDRGLSDIGQARTYQGEDYGRAIAGLDRQYQRLGNRQLQSGNAAGVNAGGFLAQARRKRAENQAWDRQPIDTQNTRALAGFAQSEQRLGEDFSTQSTRLGEGRDRGQGELVLNAQRYGEDQQTGLVRGQRELTEFEQDIGAGRFYQAAGTGWAPPPKPEGQGTRFGVTYQWDDDRSHATLPTGRRVSAQGLRNILARARARNPTAARV